MAIRHLTDTEFQDYLDKDFHGNNIYSHNHLNECKLCRQELHQYRLLYSGLKEDNGYNLNPGFSETVLTRIIANQPVKTRSMFERVVFLFGMLVLAVWAGIVLL